MINNAQNTGNSSIKETGTLTIKGRMIDGYSVFDASTATKTATPIMEIPQSIQVVPQQVMQDQQALNLGEVLENVSGVQARGTDRTGLINRYTVRGFPLSPSGNFYKNGRPYVFSVPPPIEALERIEFLKGPASVLYGQSEPGGIVNMVLKKPTAQQFTRVSLQAGSYDYYKAHLDTSGPMGEQLGYRINLSHIDKDSFRDFQHTTQSVATAVLQWDPAPWVEFSINGSYQKREQLADSGLVATLTTGAVLGSSVLDVPVSTFLNEPWTEVVADAREAGYDLRLYFNDHWHLRNSANWQRQVTDELRADPRTVQSDGGLGKTMRDRHIEQRTIFTEVSLLGEYDVAQFNHKLLFGADYRDSVRGFTEAVPDLASISASDFNVFNPVYTDAPPPGFGERIFMLSRNTLDQTGLYYQGQHSYDEWFHVLLGVRHDSFLNKLERSGIANNNFIALDQDLSDTTYRGGLLFETWQDVSLFVSYSESFRPNIDPFATEILDPQQGKQWETGIKMALLDGFLLTTFTVFDLTKTNVVIINPVSQILNIAGERVAKGIEIDAIGELSRGWNMVVNYAFLEAEITKGDPRPQGTPGVPSGDIDITGNTPPASPKHSGRLWLTYQFQSSSWLGWRLGGGVFARSEVQGDFNNTLQHPGYARLDAMFGWAGKLNGSDINFQLNLKNILDKEYFNGSSRNFIKPGAPFTVVGQLAVAF